MRKGRLDAYWTFQALTSMFKTDFIFLTNQGRLTLQIS